MNWKHFLLHVENGTPQDNSVYSYEILTYVSILKDGMVQ